MRKVALLIFVLLSGSMVNAVLAKNTNRIELTDGSVVNGKIVSYASGVYTVASDGVGTIQIDESRIKNIGFAASINDQLPAQTGSLQSQIMANPKTAEAIRSLKDDPQVQDIMNDPEVISALKAGDLNALAKNEKFMGLTKNPRIQKIKDDLSTEGPRRLVVGASGVEVVGSASQTRDVGVDVVGSDPGNGN
jgi:hypothetical protein